MRYRAGSSKLADSCNIVSAPSTSGSKCPVRVIVGLRVAHAQHRQHGFEAGRRVDLEVLERCGNLRAPLVQLAVHVGHASFPNITCGRTAVREPESLFLPAKICSEARCAVASRRR
jgi:hypothetical protein